MTMELMVLIMYLYHRDADDDMISGVEYNDDSVDDDE